MQIARDHGLTFYDASYLSLAIKTKADIATHDKKLIAAAKSEGIALFSIES